jgi:hypothetical protein
MATNVRRRETHSLSGRRMIRSSPNSKHVMSPDARGGEFRLSWAYTLTIEALHVMCTGEGAVHQRLALIDPEFLKLECEDFPEQEGVRERYGQFQKIVRQFQPLHEVLGTEAPTSKHPSSEALEQMAQLLWEIHRDFSHFMQSDASPISQSSPSARWQQEGATPAAK